MLETNKQALLFNFGEDLSYFVILQNKLRDLIKIYDDFVNDPMKGDLRRLCYYFRSARKVWLWLHKARKSLLGLSFMTDNQTV